MVGVAVARSGVARMQRSEIRGFPSRFPDCAALHPGYGL